MSFDNGHADLSVAIEVSSQHGIVFPTLFTAFLFHLKLRRKMDELFGPMLRRLHEYFLFLLGSRADFRLRSCTYGLM